MQQELQIFGAHPPTLRAYWVAILRKVWQKRGEAAASFGATLLLGFLSSYLRLRYGILPKSQFQSELLSLVIPFVAYGFLFALLEIALAAYRLHREQAIDLNTKQLLLDATAADVAEQLSRVRNSRDRREAAMRVSFQRRADEMAREISELRARQIEPDVTIEYDSARGIPRLRNYGAAACNVEITPLELDLDRVEFRRVPDIGADAVDVVFEVSPRFPFDPRSPFELAKARDLVVLARKEARCRAIELQAPGYNSGVTDAMIKNMPELMEIRISIRYTDRHATGTWEKTELLKYDGRNNRAYIEHGERRRI